VALRHVLIPGGSETVCGIELPFKEKLQRAGHTAGHQLQGRICRRCRRRLLRFPQLVAAIAAEMRASGHRPTVRELSLAPMVSAPAGCPVCYRPHGTPHAHGCDRVRDYAC